MKVIKIDPFTAPVEMEISGDLKSLQDAVHGWIEIVHHAFVLDNKAVPAVLLVNEEGLLRGLPFNLYAGSSLFGPVVVCGEREGEDGGELCDSPITFEEFKRARPDLWSPVRCGR